MAVVVQFRASSLFLVVRSASSLFLVDLLLFLLILLSWFAPGKEHGESRADDDTASGRGMEEIIAAFLILPTQPCDEHTLAGNAS